MIYIGIDPGQSGGIAFIKDSGPSIYAFGLLTERDICETINRERDNTPDDQVFAMLEKVGAFPGQGVSSTWKFGQHYGLLRGILSAQGVPFELVSPRKWQKFMGCLTGGDKNVSKAAAQRLFPSVKMTHAFADALLLAEYCRRIHSLKWGGAINEQ